LTNATDYFAAAPTPASCWRAIVLFGRNVASYKFALAETLLAQKRSGSDLIKLEELAVPFAKAICRHLQHSPIQGTSASSQFLEHCRSFAQGNTSEDQLRDATVRLGFINVIDAFHNVNGEGVPTRFFVDERSSGGGLRLTDHFLTLAESAHAVNLPFEIEARWRLVETAWRLGLHEKLITLSDRSSNPELVAAVDDRRVPVTSARHALSGYQKGKCFYCGTAITLISGADQSAEVDHLLPHALMSRGVRLNLDGVWNLVLSCRDCNRGPRGKFALLPAVDYIARLATRNDYYVSSHHPLGETITLQTGSTAEQRCQFLRDAYHKATELLVHTWRADSREDATL